MPFRVAFCKRFILLFFLALASFLSVAMPALADGIKVSPSIIEKTITPGEVFEQAISITNESASNMRIYIFLRDFTADGEEGSPKLLVPGSAQGSYMSSWISDYEANGVDIGPGASHNFNFKITVPKDAGPGGYYGALVFGTKAEDIRTNSGDKGAASAISQQAGALLLMQVPGETDEAASIREFYTDRSAYNMPFNVNFTTRVENQGNVHIKPRGVVQISNMFDKEVATVKVNDIAANVLPKSVRKFSSSWADKTGFGRYKATLAMTYGAPVENGGNGQQSLTSVTYFWVIPWKIVTYSTLALLLIALIIYLLLRRYKKRAMEMATREFGIGNVTHQRLDVSEPSKHLSIMMGIILLLLLVLLAAVIFLLFA